MVTINSMSLNRAIVLFASGALLLILTLACRPYGPAVAGTAADVGLPGDPESNPSANAYANGLGWQTSGTALQLPCAQTECGQNHVVNVIVYLHARTWQIRSDLVISGANGQQDGVPGHIVAKIVSQDAFTVHDYGFEGKDIAYLWVGWTKRHGPAFALYKIDETGVKPLSFARRGVICRYQPSYPTAKPHTVPPTTNCDVPDTIYDYSGAKALSPQNRPLRLTSNITALKSSPLASMNDGLWFSCSLGCCQATDFAFY